MRGGFFSFISHCRRLGIRFRIAVEYICVGRVGSVAVVAVVAVVVVYRRPFWALDRHFVMGASRRSWWWRHISIGFNYNPFCELSLRSCSSDIVLAECSQIPWPEYFQCNGNQMQWGFFGMLSTCLFVTTSSHSLRFFEFLSDALVIFKIRSHFSGILEDSSGFLGQGWGFLNIFSDVLRLFKIIWDG